MFNASKVGEKYKNKHILVCSKGSLLRLTTFYVNNIVETQSHNIELELNKRIIQFIYSTTITISG